jgi:hypothetical protein
MNILGAVVSGMVGTIVLSMVLALAPRMGMPKMDIVGMLGSMFNKDGNQILGWGAHFMMGIVFAIVYALLWSAGISGATWVTGLVFGAVHWLIVGLMMGVIPMMHAGIKAGTVKAPGLYMTNQGGVMAFMGGLIGHMIFGLVVALVYGAFLA